MSRVSRVLVATVVAFVLVTASAWAQGPAPRPRRPGMQRFMAGLNLSDQQREQIRTLRQEHRAAIRDQVQQLRDARRALREETFADQSDRAKIDAVQHRVLELSQQVEAHRMELQQRIAQVLTPEQRQYMRNRADRMRAFRAGRTMGRGRRF